MLLTAAAAAPVQSKSKHGGHGDHGHHRHANDDASPPPFWLGVATAAYQIEGGVTEGGRGASIWDAFSHRPNTTARGAPRAGWAERGAAGPLPSTTPQPPTPPPPPPGDTGDVADDFYHLYPADAHLAAALGARRFRLSLSWPRLFPNGESSGPANEEGLAFYDRIIDTLLEAGVEPWITLCVGF